MINVRQYRFTMINDDNGTSKVLGVNPGGWENVQERIYRHEKYNGVMFEDETSLKYPRLGGDIGGYQFIIDAYEAKGVKAQLYLKREKLNPFTNGYEPDTYRKFDFDVDSGWTIMDEYIEIKTIESGDVNKLLIRDEIEYNVFSLKSSDNLTVKAFENAYKEALYKKIDVYLKAKTYGYFNGIFEDGASQLTVTGTSGGGYEDIKYVNYYGFKSENDIDDRLIVTESSNTAYLYKNTLDDDATAFLTKFAINYISNTNIFIFSESSNFTLYLYLVVTIYDDEGAPLPEIGNNRPIRLKGSSNNWFFRYDGGLDAGSELWVRGTFDFEQSLFVLGSPLPVQNGYRVDFRLKAQLQTHVANKTVVASFNFFTNQNYIRSFSFYEKTTGRPDNKIVGMMAHEAVTRQIQLMTSKLDENIVYAPILGNTDSEFQDYTSAGYLGYEHLTNGYLLRQFEDQALNMSFKDTFKSLDSVYPIGLWFDPNLNSFYIDKIEQFYKKELFPFILEEIKDLNITPAKYFYFNEIDSGYPVIDHEDFQGVKELNTETAHQISIETSNKIDVRSPYNAGSIGIELARRKNKDTTTSEDTKYDSEIFITKLNSDYETIQGELDNLEGFAGISEYYNLTKTPRQNLQRQLKLYQAALFKDSNEIVQFTKAAKDNNVSYKDPQTGIIVNEYDDIHQTGDVLVKPEFYKIDAIYTYFMRQEIKKDPHRVIVSIDKDGKKKYGYIWEINGNVDAMKATFKLIRANEKRLDI